MNSERSRLACSLAVGCLVAVVAVSCVAVPEPSPEPPIADPIVLTVEPEKPADPVVEEVATVEDPSENIEPEVVEFNPESISAQVKETTFTDVKTLIQNLNSIIQSKNYEAWSSYLTYEYRMYYSDIDNLTRLSDSPVLKRLNIRLTNLQDYFLYVVYPSRQNDRVDDVEFLSENNIRAITVNPKGERLVLYNLEKIGDTWKIGNWR